MLALSLFSSRLLECGQAKVSGRVASTEEWDSRMGCERVRTEVQTRGSVVMAIFLLVHRRGGDN
jgi:hypothetical protein